MKKKNLLIFIITIIILSLHLNAQTWGPLQRLTWNSGDSKTPVIAIDSSNKIHMVWADKTPGNSEIYYKKSTDSGTTWTGNKRLTWDPETSINPSIAVDSADRIHFVWIKFGNHSYPGIRYKKSTNSGTTWIGRKSLGYSKSNVYPSLAVDNADRIHIVWVKTSRRDETICYQKSTDSGTTWSSKIITFDSLKNLKEAYISSTGSSDLLIYFIKAGDIYIKRSTDSGNNWTGKKRLTWNIGSSKNPMTDVDSSGNIFLIWEDSIPGNGEIYFKKSTDGGINWGSKKRLTWTVAEERDPCLEIDTENQINITWRDNYKVYFRKSTNGGTTWSAKKRIAWMSGTDPFIISDNKNLHLVWAGYTPEDKEIFYKKACLEPTPILSAPTSSTGTFTLTITYNWPLSINKHDRFLLYEKLLTSSTWTRIQESTYGQHPNPWKVELSRPSGNYSYKVRAYVGSGHSPGYTPDSNIKTVRVVRPPEITAYASADNTIRDASDLPQVSNTVFQWGDLSVGNQFTGTFSTTSIEYVASVLKFDGLQAQITNQSIASAILKLYPTVLPQNWETEYTVNALAGSWNTTTITWNNCPSSYVAFESRQSPPDNLAVPLEFDITQIIQQWADGTWENNGLIVKDAISTPPFPYTAIRTTNFISSDAYDDPDKRPQIFIIFN